MIPLKWVIHPSAEELADVRRLLLTTDPDEAQHDGVWVRHDGSSRLWSGSTQGVSWFVRGSSTSEDLEEVFLPARVVTEAYTLSHFSETVTILIPADEGVAIVSSPGTSTVIDLQVPRRSTPVEPTRESAARARVTAGDLNDLVARASQLPSIEGRDEYPSPILTIVDGVLSIHADWSVRGGCRTTYQLAADTEGAAECIIPLADFRNMLVSLDRDVEVEIDCPLDALEPIILREPRAWSTYAFRPNDARRFHYEVSEVLHVQFGEETQVIAMGSFGFELDDRQFTVQLLDAPDEFIRIATPVCERIGGLAPSEELLRQINEVNEGLVACRLWADHERVWSAIDLPVSAFESIPWAIEKLHTQLAGFDVFLGGLFSEIP